MSTRRLLAAALLFGFAAALVVFVAPFDCAKVGTVAQLRRSLPKVADGAAGAAQTTTVFVAFDRKPTADNLFFANGRDVYEQRGRHQLIVRFSDAEPQWDIVSYVTSIMYLNERMNTLSFHPFPARTGYRAAMADLEQLCRKLDLHDKISWTEYETRLNSLIEMHEVYVPRVALPAATVQPYMNCNWDVDQVPRKQLDRVECYPIVYVTPAKGGAP